MFVGVLVIVGVFVIVEVLVGMKVAVAVGVCVGVGVFVGVEVTVGVLVGRAVGEGGFGVQFPSRKQDSDGPEARNIPPPLSPAASAMMSGLMPPKATGVHIP